MSASVPLVLVPFSHVLLQLTVLFLDQVGASKSQDNLLLIHDKMLIPMPVINKVFFHPHYLPTILVIFLLFLQYILQLNECPVEHSEKENFDKVSNDLSIKNLFRCRPYCVKFKRLIDKCIGICVFDKLLWRY